MKRFTRVALVATAVAIPVGIFAASGSTAFATTTPVKFTGSITCTTTGSFTATPPIGSVSQTSTVKLSAKLASCTGSTSEKGVTIKAGTATSSFKITGTCSTLLNGLPANSISVKYTANTPGAKPSKVADSGIGVGSNSAGSIVLSLPNSGGTTTTTGSFANSSNGSKASFVIDQSASTLLADCNGTGVSKLSFTGKNGASSITVG